MKFAPSASPAHFIRVRRLVPQSEKTPPHPLSEEWQTSRAFNQNRERRPVRRRTSRTFARYCAVLLIGIIATLAFQSYREKIMEVVRAEVPSLAWLLPVSTANPPAAAGSPQLVQQLDAILAQQLEPGLATVRHSVEQLTSKVEQLAAQQDQITKTIEILQAAEQEISQKLSSRAAAPHKSQQQAAQSAAAQSSPVSLAPPPVQQPSR